MSGTDGQTLAGHKARAGEARAKAGVLVLVVGPSGAGKDTLISLARREVEREGVLFARRYITREVDLTENHIVIDETEFTEGVAQGRFPLHWRANGLCYALGGEMCEQLEAGHVVVANGSRKSVPEARARFAGLKVVHITAPVELLAARIAGRGRESEEAVAQRLSRDAPLDGPVDLTIINDGTPEAGAARLVEFLRGL